jgi:hypothetical protein
MEGKARFRAVSPYKEEKKKKKKKRLFSWKLLEIRVTAAPWDP